MNQKNNLDPILMNPQYAHQYAGQNRAESSVQQQNEKLMNQVSTPSNTVQNEQQNDRRQELRRKGYNFDPDTGEYIGESNIQTDAVLKEQKPMNWFKFIIYFQLIFNAVLNLTNALTYYKGAHYGVDPDLIYDFYGEGLRVCDIFIALFCMVLVVYAFVVRYALSRYKSYAPMMYIGVWILSALPTILYQVISTVVTGEANINITLWVQLIVPNTIWAIINYIYFKKRKHLFNNPVGKKEATVNVFSITLFTIQAVSLYGIVMGGGFSELNPVFLIGFFLPTIIGIILQIITTNKRKKERQMNSY